MLSVAIDPERLDQYTPDATTDSWRKAEHDCLVITIQDVGVRKEATMRTDPVPRNCYRLPWSLTDNAISWLEITNKCNLDCEGCYRDKRGGGHKSIEEIEQDLAIFRRQRKSDCMSIAGGDPLVHPDIVEVVRRVRRGGWKPIVNTNGLALTRDLLHDLKSAGVFGFTFHVDSSQKRPDSPIRDEKNLNALRELLAEMVAAEGNIACSFNQTVSEDTLRDVPEVVRWSQTLPGIVHSIVFILYRRLMMMRGFDYFVNGNRLENLEGYADRSWGGIRRLTASDVVAAVREADPDYSPCAYLNGTEDPDSLKWLLAVRAAWGEKTVGYVSPRTMEAIQTAHHMFRDRWLSYCSPRALRLGLLSALLLSPFDSEVRGIARSSLSAAVRGDPFRTIRLQAYMIIQPIDLLPDGRMNMCDGCPDITVHNGRLCWSCRLEEVKLYGRFVTAYPKREASSTAVGDDGRPDLAGVSARGPLQERETLQSSDRLQ